MERGTRITGDVRTARPRSARRAAIMRGLRSDSRGQVLVEYAIIFPLQLVITLVIIQLAHLFVAKQVMEYAAFCGARAALVADPADREDDARRAVIVPLSRIAGGSGVTDPDELVVPGWGILPGSKAAEQKITSLDVYDDTAAGAPIIRCELFFAYELSVPIGDLVAYQLVEMLQQAEATCSMTGGAPHVILKATCALAKPWTS